MRSHLPPLIHSGDLLKFMAIFNPKLSSVHFNKKFCRNKQDGAAQLDGTGLIW